MNPLDSLNDEVNDLIGGFISTPMYGSLSGLGFSQYSFWRIVATIVLLAVMLIFTKQQAKSLVPKGWFVNGIEFLVEFVRDDMCRGILGDTWREHFAFIATVFFYVLVNNVIGIIPGCKPGTGTISTTAALALCSFVYFIYCGIKKRGAWNYIKSLAPEGVAFPLNALVWVIELFSTFLRLVTLAVRLFCNLFAGHIVMGVFALLAALFIEPLLQEFSVQALAMSSASIGWVAVLIIIYLVEILVAAIQAYVFALLSAVYIQTAEGEE